MLVVSFKIVGDCFQFKHVMSTFIITISFNEFKEHNCVVICRHMFVMMATTTDDVGASWARARGSRHTEET